MPVATRDTGYRLGAAQTLVVLGHAARRTGDTGAATDLWRQAVDLFTDIGCAPGAEQVRTLLGPGPVS
jgi:hypothetical protein